jgi:hypothetical protein
VATSEAAHGLPRWGGARDAPAHAVSQCATNSQEGSIMDKPRVMTLQTDPQRKAPLPLTSFRPPTRRSRSAPTRSTRKRAARMAATWSSGSRRSAN